MKWKFRVAKLSLLAACMMAALGATAQDEEAIVELNVGDKAPNFTLPGSDGNNHSLEQYKGKQAVVLAFFPKAFTGG